MQPDIMQGAMTQQTATNDALSKLCKQLKQTIYKNPFAFIFIKLQEWVLIPHVGVCGHPKQHVFDL